MAERPADQFWRLPIGVYERTCMRPFRAADAATRLAEFGHNTIADAPRRGIALKIAKRLTEPLVAILLVAAAISASTGDIASFGIIVTVIALSIILDVVQEHRAELAVDALKRSVAIHADVLRDGEFVSVPVDQVVPGDVVELKAGDLVPADGVVISGRNAHVDEALMTGEAFPAEKRAGPCDAAEPAEAVNALFAGTRWSAARRT